MTETLTKDRIEKLAPDQASLGAALKLMKPSTWPVMARMADASLLWGECQGSGATPYRVIVSPSDVGYKCTCPSRKFPCKHVLAVMWMHCDKPERFEPGAAPDWVQDWLARRRPKVGAPAGGCSDGSFALSITSGRCSGLEPVRRTTRQKFDGRDVAPSSRRLLPLAP
jgi:SWIM zinc finger